KKDSKSQASKGKQSSEDKGDGKNSEGQQQSSEKQSKSDTSKGKVSKSQSSKGKQSSEDKDNGKGQAKSSNTQDKGKAKDNGKHSHSHQQSSPEQIVDGEEQCCCYWFIDVTTDREAYTLGDTVTLSGRVSPINVKEQVVIQVFNPKNEAYRFAQISIDNDGSFSYNFPIGGRLAIDGIYSVRVTYIGVQETITFNVESAYLLASIERATLSALVVLDQTGSATETAGIGEQLTIQSEVTNNQNIIQSFAYIVQIKDSNDLTVKISWMTGELEPNQSLQVGISWVPDSAGDFTVEVFVWESIDTPVPLSPVHTTSLNVTDFFEGDDRVGLGDF
ncbi:MAG: hypothetical protein ACE5J2_02030, partial [Nitrososphaerales archaeon]